MDDHPTMDADLTLSQLDSLAPKATFSRRGFAMTSLGVGFALAAQPIQAQTVITTTDDGLDAGEVKVPVKGGVIPAYRARPHNGKDAPVVLVIHEIFGVHEHIKDLCRRLAHAGYYAIAPDLYARVGDATKVSDIPTLMSTIVGKTSDAQVRGDLDAAVAFAVSEKADAKRLAVTGFCWGGRQTWLYTEATPGVRAAAAWYGPLKGDNSPVDAAAKVKGRVIGFYGGKDTGITAADVASMRKALADSGDKESRIIVYPDAPHGFNADYRPSYVAADAKEAWQNMLAWFRGHGV
ncbi:MAG TPA: dienelactone hydrolase family protein [Caulobacteraceae bacterium]